MARVGGVVGIWSDDHKCVQAAHKVREAGYKKFDAITPFPVHGMEEAIGIKRSWIPWVTFFAGLTGFGCAIALEYWTLAVDWPVNIGGKPLFAGPAYVPIMFELTVLFAALCSVGTLFAVCGLPSIDPPVIDPDLTSHKFALFIPENDVGFEAARCEQLLKGLGAEIVRRIAEY